MKDNRQYSALLTFLSSMMIADGNPKSSTGSNFLDFEKNVKLK